MIAQADARNLPLADDSVSVIVTSPPFWGCGEYGGDMGRENTYDDYLINAGKVQREILRVLKPIGRAWVQAGFSRRKANNAGAGWMFRLESDGEMKLVASEFTEGSKWGLDISWERQSDYPFGVFSQSLLDELLSRSPEGLVCDPFCGSGSVGEAARRHGRPFVGFDVVPEFCELARERLAA